MTKLIQDIEIGPLLRKYRAYNKFSQADVVRRMNLFGSTMSDSTYAKIEQGYRNIRMSDLVILKIVLKFEYAELFQEFEQLIMK